MNIAKIFTSLRESESRAAEGLRFVITGGIATALQYAFYLLLLSVCGLKPTLSAVVSYLLSFVANYVMSNLFTFHTRPGKKNAMSFLASHLINLGLQTGLVAIFSRLIAPAYALLPAMIICVPCNFFLVRFALKSKYFS